MENIIFNDAELIKAYIEGSEEAFKTLVNQYKRKVFTTIYLIVRNKDVAEDLLQDVFIKAIHTLKSGRYNEEGKFGPWICRVGHNLAIDYYRKNSKFKTSEFQENREVFSNNIAYSVESIEKEKIQKDNINKLKSLIDRLPETQKEVLSMRYFADMSFREIADFTGVSINTALGRMRYALINLRKEMEEHNLNLYI